MYHIHQSRSIMQSLGLLIKFNVNVTLTWLCIIPLAYCQPINPWELPARRKAAGAKFKAAETAATAACAETLR
jgi:hypothetical protein